MIINISVDVDSVLFYSLLCTIIVLILYVCIDVHYFLTKFVILIWCKIRQNRVNVDETTEYYGICTTNDLDIYFQHMNNAKYVRELDFARFHFYKRTGIYEFAVNTGSTIILQSACHIRYRKPIPLFTPYKVTTKVIYWDEKHIYIEHQFVKLSDGFITTVILCKQTFLGINVIEMMNKLLKNQDETYRPKPPTELEEWIQLNKKSSARLMNGKL